MGTCWFIKHRGSRRSPARTLLTLLAGVLTALYLPVTAAADDSTCPHHWPAGFEFPDGTEGTAGHDGGDSHEGHSDHGGQASKAPGDHVLDGKAPDAHAGHASHSDEDCECVMVCAGVAGPAAPGLPVAAPLPVPAPEVQAALSQDGSILPGPPAYLLPFTRPPPPAH